MNTDQSKTTPGDMPMPARLRDPAVAKAIERHVQRRTRGHIRMLHVSVNNGRVIVHGQTDATVFKQLAVLATMEVLGRNEPNQIELHVPVQH